jgi:hypothetical protein
MQAESFSVDGFLCNFLSQAKKGCKLLSKASCTLPKSAFDLWVLDGRAQDYGHYKYLHPIFNIVPLKHASMF